MANLLSLSRAARLAGVARGALQRRIKEGELDSFDGMVDADELLRVFPDTQLEDVSELERVARIKDRAFGKRVFERSLPDKEVLAARINEIGRELAQRNALVEAYQGILGRLMTRLAGVGQKGDDAMAELREWLGGELEQAGSELALPGGMAGRDSYLKVMAAQVKLLPSGREFLLEGNDTILEAALRAGVSLGYGCSSGNCGQCKAKVLSGKVKYTRSHDYVFTEAEKAQNYTLMCSCTAVSDVVIEAGVALRPGDLPVQRITAKVKAMQRLSDDMMVLELLTPRSSRLRFMAGQSAALQIAGLRHEAPIASCPCEERLLQFHLRYLPGNHFSEHVFNRLEVGDGVEVEGPKGRFVLNDDSPRSLVFIAWGEGFAPVMGLIGHALSLETAETLHLYWAALSAEDIYLPNQCRAWEDALENFRYTPLVMEGVRSTAGVQGEKRLRALLEAVRQDYPDPAGYDFYVAGPEAQVTATQALLREWGVPEGQLYAEVVHL